MTSKRHAIKNHSVQLPRLYHFQPTVNRMESLPPSLWETIRSDNEWRCGPGVKQPHPVRSRMSYENLLEYLSQTLHQLKGKKVCRWVFRHVLEACDKSHLSSQLSQWDHRQTVLFVYQLDWCSAHWVETLRRMAWRSPCTSRAVEWSNPTPPWTASSEEPSSYAPLDSATYTPAAHRLLMIAPKRGISMIRKCFNINNFLEETIWKLKRKWKGGKIEKTLNT